MKAFKRTVRVCLVSHRWFRVGIVSGWMERNNGRHHVENRSDGLFGLRRRFGGPSHRLLHLRHGVLSNGKGVKMHVCLRRVGGIRGKLPEGVAMSSG